VLRRQFFLKLLDGVDMFVPLHHHVGQLVVFGLKFHPTLIDLFDKPLALHILLDRFVGLFILVGLASHINSFGRLRAAVLAGWMC